MFLQQEKYYTATKERIERLQTMLENSHADLMQKVRRANQQVLQNKKNKKYQNILKQRITMSENFIEVVSDTNFKMLADQNFLMLTTQTDVIEKVEKFKKNVINSLQKISQNLQNESERRQGTNEYEQRMEEQEGDEEQKSKPGASDKRKSKNFKISLDGSVRMIEWLLANFQKPYPTIAEKQQMATLGGITLTKVNNWFINARERTVKSYFNKEI